MGSTEEDDAARTLVRGKEPEPTGESAPIPASVERHLVLEDPIGEGGSGVVRRALDPKLKRHVAVKTLAPRLRRQQRAVARFVQEAQITAQLEHPNIVPVHNLEVARDGAVYFTMRLVEGRTLAALIADSSRAEQAETDRLYELLQAFLKVCDAVAFAHSRDVIHCDIKPENIMVGAYGEVYLMDWGVCAISPGATAEARAVEAPGQQLAVRGTPEYMAPEQASGRGADLNHRTDVFGLGAVLYEILTGRPPFEAESSDESLERARACAFTPPLDVPGVTVAPGIARVVMRAMASRPDDRYSSVLELRREVGRFLRGGWNLPTKDFQAGAVIVAEGDWGDAAYIITKGRCEVSRQVDGRSVVLRRLGPGDIFGEMAIISGDRRTATVRALEDVSAKVVTRELLQEQIGMDTWLGKLVVTLADRFRELEDSSPGAPRS